MLPRIVRLETFAAIAAFAMVTLFPARVHATTGLETTVPVQVTLSDAGVKFSTVVKADTDTTLELRITNRGVRRRSFRIGDRESHQLRKGQSEFIYFSFHVPGKVAWRSRATGGRLFTGKFNVKPADRFGIPQG
jgi:hypothetical protein